MVLGLRLYRLYVAIFVLTFGCEFPVLGNKALAENSQPVVKEKWGIGVLFLSIAALCYILGQLGFISGYRNMPKASA